MKILLVNKFLFYAGGAEKYMFNLGQKLLEVGNKVEYFGLDDERKIAGNEFDIYADPHFTPKRVIYSEQNKKNFNKLIDKFKPDIVHMNNISFQLTSSLIDACKEKKVPVVMTVHDPQLVCPNHMLYYEKRGICEDCLDMDFKHCLKNKCLKNSIFKSFLAYKESKMTHECYKYGYISKYICPSNFIKNMLIKGGYPEEKCAFLQNFVFEKKYSPKSSEKEDYILYYGRLSEEKGIKLLLESLPENVNLVVAGSGPMVTELKGRTNVKYVGFKTGEELNELIHNAKATVYPSIWYENCPLSIMESISLGTPVIGSNLGGIPELIKDSNNGFLFKPNDRDDLRRKIQIILDGANYLKMSINCYLTCFETAESYVNHILKIYKEAIENEETFKQDNL
jgi:glycosyltransferase involved in cell wall biosynthesis